MSHVSGVINERPPVLSQQEEESWLQIVNGWQGDESLSWIDADSVPKLQEARLLGRLAAENIFDERMQQLRDGEFDSVPEPVDPLTTASRALKARKEHGAGSEAYKKAYYSLVVDCERLWAEAMRKNTWEYFPEIEQTYDEQSGGYQFMGRPLLDMVRDGVTPVAEKEEQHYRIGEYVEEITYGAVRRLGWTALSQQVPAWYSAAQKPGVRVITVSECANWAIEAYHRKSKAGFGGYVPEIKKHMIRGVRFDEETGNRFQEQIGLPGIYYTDEVIIEAMQCLRMAVPGQQLTKAERRSKQAINLDGKGVIYVTKLLDDIASRHSGKNIFLGEVVPKGYPKNYDDIPAEAIARQKNITNESHALANFLMMLEEKGTDHSTATGLVERHVKKTLFGKIKHDPQQVADAFDDKTASTLQEAVQERAIGNEQKAQTLERKAWEDAPSVIFCGAGSCGLVEVDFSDPKTVAMMAKLNFEPGDSIVRTESPCVECSRKGRKGNVYIVYNESNKVNKGCADCGATEFGGKRD